jgi:rod shape-determining protein MreD
MRRPLVLLAPLLLLWAVVSVLNDALSELRVYVFAGGLFVAYAALHQPQRAGLAAVMLAGLICDANAPIAFGTNLLLFAAGHVTLFHLRERLPREDNVAAVVVVLFTNLTLFLVFSFTQIHASPAPAAVWPRLLSDLLWSQIFLTLVTPWFFALQAGALALARLPREDTV